MAMPPMDALDRWVLEVLIERAAMPRSRIARITTGWSSRVVNQALERLATAGFVEPVEKTHWRLTDAGWRVGPAGPGELPLHGPEDGS